MDMLKSIALYDSHKRSGHLSPRLWGLVPLLAVSVDLVSGLTIGMIAICGLVFTMAPVSLLRQVTPYWIQLPLLLLFTTTIVTLILLVMQSLFYKQTASFGVYLPLLAVNCLLLAQPERVIAPSAVLLESINIGMGVLFITTIIGAARQLFDYAGLNVLTLAPGVFICLGLFMAVSQKYKVKKALHNE